MLAELVFHHDGQLIVDFRKAWATACVANGLGFFVAVPRHRWTSAEVSLLSSGVVRKNIIGPHASISSNSFVKQFAAITVTVFNFANFDLPSIALNGLLTEAAGKINGTTPMGHNVDRVGVGTGVYSLGAPRAVGGRATANLLVCTYRLLPARTD